MDTNSSAVRWASDNEFTGRIPDFIGNWTQLQTLRFEGNSFEGSIPPSFSRLTSLQELRISGLSNGTMDFIRDLKSLSVLVLRNNRISDPIPADIGEYQSLIRLFLGNNSLNGTLPDIKSASLSNIDVSYNKLSGTLPSWVNETNLQLNLVVNNFTLRDIGNSGLPSGLICLQRNFPCGRGSPSYSDFGINCGGPPITSSNQLLHEQDNGTLRAASYYVTSERRWGVSNVGQSENPIFAVSSSRQFTNTLDSELFQTARISAGSLRYYGLGLENGNYTVTLQFAELQIEDGPTWRSTGRRVFDIYLMGNRVFQDFDIKREAGGASFSPVSRQTTVQVSDNYLEVHLFWSGKGTCCVPYQGAFGPLISAISATPNFRPSVNNTPPSTKRKNRTGLIVEILVPIAVVSFLSLLVLYIFRQRKKQDTSDNYDQEFLGIDAKPYTFSYGDLRDATDDFNLANKLGEGGFGPVYKGTLEDGRVIAVKQLSVASHQGKAQFIAEIATISAVQHRNLVKLYGCCIEGDKRLLVYEYLENKSLDHSYRIQYAMRGHLTEKADVFGFGVVALEMISGRPNSDTTLEDDKIYLLEWAWNLHEADNEVELVDKELYEFDENEVKRVTRIALLCTQTSPIQRPPMSRVVAMLSGDIEASGVIARPGYLSGFNFKDDTTFKSDIPSSSTNYMPSTSHSTLSLSTPDNASKSMLQDMIEEGR
ncbi:hypothetical protein L1987_85255 [Smallanthus sonchifolius]|uniref:Uncharacterized protein n=3 Tax=Smallanthus sonchifolius TaxID=185202 RepID=A0ACB8XW79_9ASTR|nr:hypothetical protein L1987_85251 [Smallanthus sonchifolius]KAI3675661.1 hypothetical protein L1987_85253 [Smallanthus sonchifolius]KAI3675663.1 hypothetical protein L1987_85255 [Smallanthus sonchifolius]